MKLQIRKRKQGKYIAIEGIDGSGKSELTVAVKKLIEVRDGKCDAFKCPSYDGPIGRLIRNVFAGNAHVEPRAMMHLFAADAIDQERYLFERLLIGNDCVLDRHNAISAMVYQRPVPYTLKTILDVNALHLYRPPDLLVWLHVPTEVAFERLQNRDGKPSDAMYQPKTEQQLELCRGRYELAMTVMGEAKWARDTLTIAGDESVQDIAAQVCERIGRKSTLHRATVEEARKLLS